MSKFTSKPIFPQGFHAPHSSFSRICIPFHNVCTIAIYDGDSFTGIKSEGKQIFCRLCLSQRSLPGMSPHVVHELCEMGP